MNKPILRCRCGHQVFGKEVLRTEPYEKESGREAVYVKYRCRRCKRLGEAFFDDLEWNPSIFEAPRNELSDAERDRFIDEKAISSSDVISFHRALGKTVTLEELKRLEANPRGRRSDKSDSASKTRKNNEKGNGETPSQARRPNS
ncbi:MAG TPA: hypothetical protein VGB45_09210 [Abditibacterium sp.]|jgi:hypothetical protein